MSPIRQKQASSGFSEAKDLNQELENLSTTSQKGSDYGGLEQIPLIGSFSSEKMPNEKPQGLI